ncbi:klp-19 [Pristionchus pacificus]|nr:klp-19 [Pristionchus pacificus]|eukprot:PDM60698.1 klp-19 [Pristionchus pacificus]
MAAQDGVIPIRVLVRVRPLSKKENNENAQECVRTYVEQNQISCNDKMFAFDAVFDPASSQDDVYLASAGVLVDKLFAGYNCTILAYGQTGSGKTHTMGTEETTSTMLAETRGIVPRIVSRIFECIAETEQPQAFSVKVSMLEVYDDKVIDLLTRNPSREGLQIREKDGAPFVQGLSTHDVGSLVTTMGMLERGCSLRSKGETAMNAASSRSHAVFTILVEKIAVPNDESVWESKLRLVDLAGSERLKKTMAEGERKKEGIKINEGLHALGKVIQALSAEEKHIPYRDSKITRLLQDSLGGSSYTVMIACVSPADSNGEETLSTLRYADRVKSIKNKPTVQLDPTQALIQKLRDENASLRLEVAAYRAGEVPDIIVPLSSLPPSMNGPAKAQPLQKTAAPPSQTPGMGMGTPRRVVRREEYDEANDRVKGMEKTIAAMKEKIAEMIMYKMSHRDTTMSGDDSKMEESNMGGDDDEDDDHEEKMNGIIRNTESLEKEMDHIMKEIAVKEKLVHSNSAELSRLNAMEGEHKKQMESLTARLSELQKERDVLQDQLKKVSTTSKLSEERRKRLAEIEKELFTQRKKLNELKNIEKLKKQSDETVQRLKKEIFEMKSLRVRMTKQIKAETEKYRQQKMIADKKIAQMQSKERKRDMETSRLKQNLGQQLVVVKRKYEEATAANKRLQQQLMRSKTASVDRKMDEKTDEMWKEHVHNELELVASTYTAERSTDEMINQRKTISRTLKALNDRLKRLEGEPPQKRRTTVEGEEDNEAEKTRLLEEKRDCEEEIEKITATIQSLQSNSSDVNLASLAELRWSTVHTAAAAKLALKHLFEEAATLMRTSVDEKRMKENEEIRWTNKIEKLKGDVKEKQNKIDTMEKLKEEWLTKLNSEKVELEHRRGSLLQMILESDRVNITQEHVEQLKEMGDSIKNLGTLPKRKGPTTRRTTTRSTKSPFEDELMDGPRKTNSISRFGEVLNTMEAVKVDDENDMDTTRNDMDDKTFRLDDDDSKVSKRKTRSNAKVEDEKAGGERMEEEENGVANATFILPKEGSNEIDTKENMSGSNKERGAKRAKGEWKDGSPDDLNQLLEGGMRNTKGGGLGQIQ